MFARVKKSGRYEYLQIVENSKVDGKVRQRVIATVGRLDQLQAKGNVETLIRSLARFSEKTLLVLSGKVDVTAHAVKIGPALIFERLWREVGLPAILGDLLASRKFGFDVERAIFLTVLHRLCVSGSDRACDQWRRDYAIAGVEGIALHQMYRAMAFLGTPLVDQAGATPFAPRCTKDLVEEAMFRRHRNLFSGLELVFFDTTSIYFEGEGGGRRLASSDTARITVPTASRWWSERSSTIRAGRSAARCGPATPLMSRACCRWWRNCAAVSASSGSVSWRIGA